MNTPRFAIDWSVKPHPWCEIGPRFKREVERICGVKAPAKPLGGFQDDPRAAMARDAKFRDPDRERVPHPRPVDAVEMLRDPARTDADGPGAARGVDRGRSPLAAEYLQYVRDSLRSGARWKQAAEAEE